MKATLEFDRPLDHRKFSVIIEGEPEQVTTLIQAVREHMTQKGVWREE